MDLRLVSPHSFLFLLILLCSSNSVQLILSQQSFNLSDIDKRIGLTNIEDSMIVYYVKKLIGKIADNILANGSVWISPQNV